jgi:hypothetical protein
VPAYTHRASGDLQVTFESDGEEPETQFASTGERALKFALLMLAKRDELRDGDRLTVKRVDDGQNATVVRGLPRPQGGGK